MEHDSKVKARPFVIYEADGSRLVILNSEKPELLAETKATDAMGEPAWFIEATEAKRTKILEAAVFSLLEEIAKCGEQ